MFIFKVLKKVRSTRGESLVESMAALVVIVLAVSMLTTSVTAAARVNKRSSETKTLCEKQSSNTDTCFALTIEKIIRTTGNSYAPIKTSEGNYKIASSVTGYEDSGFYYYTVG